MLLAVEHGKAFQLMITTLSRHFTAQSVLSASERSVDTPNQYVHGQAHAQRV